MAAFFTSFWAYRRGIKDGMALGDSKPLEPIKNPVKVIQEHKEAKETKKEADQFMQGLNNMLNYDGTPQKEVNE